MPAFELAWHLALALGMEGHCISWNLPLVHESTGSGPAVEDGSYPRLLYYTLSPLHPYPPLPSPPRLSFFRTCCLLL